MMKLFHGNSQAGAVSVCQAKVVRAATGEVEYHYSTPTLPWYRFKDRRYVRNSMRNFKLAEER